MGRARAAGSGSASPVLASPPGGGEAQSTTPTVSSIAITSDPGADKTYIRGENVEITLTFSEAVTVAGGTPTLLIRIQPNNRFVSYNRGSGTTRLVFAYTVQSGDVGGVYIHSSGQFNLQSATIKDSDGNNASISYSAVGSIGTGDSNHKVDGSRSPPTDTTAPTVTGALTGYFTTEAAGAALTGARKAGANIYTKVTFSEDMKHTKSDNASARPEIFYRIGSTDTQYDIVDNGDTLASGDCKPNHASNTNVYICLYTVASSDNGALAVKVGTNSADRANNALATVYTHTDTYTLDNTAPRIAFPSGVTPTIGVASTITLTDAGAKVKRYGAIVVDGSTGTAVNCDMASEIGAGNLTTLDTRWRR